MRSRRGILGVSLPIWRIGRRWNARRGRRRRRGGGCFTCLAPTLLLLLIALLLLGMVYESVSAARTARAYPPPGDMVDVGGYRLHVQVTGEDRGRPTVVLDHAATAMSAQWGWIQPELARHTRVVVYDRPGMGWSEGSPRPLEAREQIEDIRSALQELGVTGPYVLAGHSMGALVARVFAQQYPDDVAGLVLIDPRDIGWNELLGNEAGEDTRYARILGILSRVGVVRLSGQAAREAEGLPSPSFEHGVAHWSSHTHWRNMRSESYLGDSAEAWLRQGEDLQEVPLVVLSAGEPDGAFNPEQRAALIDQHARLAALSSQGVHQVVRGAGHVTIVTQEEHARDCRGDPGAARGPRPCRQLTHAEQCPSTNRLAEDVDEAVSGPCCSSA